MSDLAAPQADDATHHDDMSLVRPVLEAADHLADVVEALGSTSGLSEHVWDALHQLRSAQEKLAGSQ